VGQAILPNAAYFLILATILPKLWGSQSWLQAGFQPAFAEHEGSLTVRKSRLKGGCRQDCLPHAQRGLAGSLTLTTRSARTSFSTWTVPDGQRISTDSALSADPSPKWTGPWLEEA
jgi:hypothetical protein